MLYFMKATDVDKCLYSEHVTLSYVHVCKGMVL